MKLVPVAVLVTFASLVALVGGPASLSTFESFLSAVVIACVSLLIGFVAGYAVWRHRKVTRNELAAETNQLRQDQADLQLQMNRTKGKVFTT